MALTKCGFDNAGAVSGKDLLVINGPTIFVDIGFDPTYTSATTVAPKPSEIKLKALVDTGATISCIDDALAIKLNLPIVDRQPISGCGGVKVANMYLAQIHIPSLAFTIYGSFAGVDLIAGGQHHQALIGRTFLSYFTMNYEGQTGTVTIYN